MYLEYLKRIQIFIMDLNIHETGSARDYWNHFVVGGATFCSILEEEVDLIYIQIVHI